MDCHLQEYTVDLLFPINSSVIYKQQVSGKRKLKFPIKIPLTACDDGEPSATESTLRKAFNLNVTSEKHQVSNNIFNNYKSLHLMMMMCRREVMMMMMTITMLFLMMIQGQFTYLHIFTNLTFTYVNVT